MAQCFGPLFCLCYCSVWIFDVSLISLYRTALHAVCFLFTTVWLVQFWSNYEPTLRGCSSLFSIENPLFSICSTRLHYLAGLTRQQSQICTNCNVSHNVGCRDRSNRTKLKLFFLSETEVTQGSTKICLSWTVTSSVKGCLDTWNFGATACVPTSILFTTFHQLLTGKYRFLWTFFLFLWHSIKNQNFSIY